MRESVRARPRARPAQDRKLQRRDRPRVRARRRAEPEARMLEQREQRHRRQILERGFARRAARTRRPRCRASASPPESSASIFQRPSAAATRRASARSGVTSAAVLPVVHRLAQRDRDGERLVLGIRGLDHGDVRERRVARRRRRCARPSARSPPTAASPRRSSRSRAARLRRARRPRRARSRCAAAARAWQAADGRRRAVAMRRRLMPPISSQDGVVEIGVEPGQHHGAVRQRRDGREQLGGRRHRAGRARGDHRAVDAPRAGCARPRSAGRAAPPDRSCRVPCRIGRPVLARDLQEVEGELPVFVEIVAAPARRAAPTRTCRVVMSSISRARSSASASADAGRVHDQRGLAGCGLAAARPTCSTSCASSSRRSQPAQRLRQLERLGAVRRVGEGEFVLVDVAERHDARQHGGIGLRAHRGTPRARARRRAASAGTASRRASASGSADPGSPSISRPSRSARISVGRNGAEAGMVKTRGRHGAVIVRLRFTPRSLNTPRSPRSPPRRP